MRIFILTKGQPTHIKTRMETKKKNELTIVEGLFPYGSDPLEAAVKAEIRLGEPAVFCVHHERRIWGLKSLGSMTRLRRSIFGGAMTAVGWSLPKKWLKPSLRPDRLIQTSSLFHFNTGDAELSPCCPHR